MTILRDQYPDRQRPSPAMIFEGVDPRSYVEKYLAPGEYVIHASRRHPVVLRFAVAGWLSALVLGLALSPAPRGHRGLYLDQVGVVISLAATVFIGWKVWQWWTARYVLTNDRVVLVEGVLSRHVHGVPLRSVLDTTYHRTFTGRLLGY